LSDFSSGPAESGFGGEDCDCSAGAIAENARMKKPSRHFGCIESANFFTRNKDSR
jgi:hypothetical protein